MFVKAEVNYRKPIYPYRPSGLKYNPFELSRGTIGRDPNTYISTWKINAKYNVKVVSASNCNIQETMKVCFWTSELCLCSYSLCVVYVELLGKITANK